MTEEEKKYYSISIETHIVERQNDDVHNLGPEHARIVCSAIFNHAQQSIRILANNLCNDDVSGSVDYISAMDTFLDKKDAKLQIILTDFNKDKFYSSPQFLFSLYMHPAYKEGRIIIKTSNENNIVNWESMDGKNRGYAHFCVADSLMTRIETDTMSRRAICNFGDEKRAKQLEEIFDTLFSRGTMMRNLNIEDLMSV